MSHHDSLVKKAEAALREVHSDQDVPIATTVESLKSLRDELDMLIDAAESDLGEESEPQP